MTNDRSNSINGGYAYNGKLDGIRALAVVFVMLSHFNFFNFFVPVSYLGVDIFFVLSGYLITTILINEHRRCGKISIKNFYARRALRLFPALLLLVIFAFIIDILFIRKTDIYYFLEGTLPTLFYFSNWVRGGLIESVALGRFFQHTWSLSIEEQYYLTWPFIIHLGLSKLKDSLKWWALGSLLLLISYKVFQSYNLTSGTSLYFSTLLHGDGILLGSVLALFLNTQTNDLLARFFGSNMGKVCFWLGLVTLILFFPPDYTSTSPYRNEFLKFNLLVGFIILALVSRDTSTGRALEHPGLTWIGKRAYGIYLYHYPIAVLLEDYVAAHPTIQPATQYLIVAFCTVLSILIAAISFRLVEAPLLSFKDRFAR